MARKSTKSTYEFPKVGEIWTFSNGERREVTAIVNNFLIEWKHISGITCGRFAKEGSCDRRGWYEGKPCALNVIL